MKKSFYIQALWDDVAAVFYSESDIIGLHIEAKTIEEFEEIIHDVAIELILENHIAPAEFATNSFKELVPTILWQRPNQNDLVCA